MSQAGALQPAATARDGEAAAATVDVSAAVRLSVAPNGRRLLAHLVDLMVFGALIFVPVLLMTMVNPNAFIGRELGMQQLLETFAALLYFVSFWRLTGTSPGKRLLGLRLVGPDGGNPSVARSLVRWSSMAILGIPFGLTWWPVLLRKDRRAVHDLLAGTRVVRY